MRILVTGSRNGPTRAFVWSKLDEAATRLGYAGLVVTDGECPDGTDLHCKAWCEARRHLGVVHDPHPANWDSCGWDCPPRAHRVRKRPGDRLHPGMLDDYCPSAGPRRNGHMVRLRPVECLGFPVGRSFGTRGCMRLAAAAGIPVKEHTP